MLHHTSHTHCNCKHTYCTHVHRSGPGVPAPSLLRLTSSSRSMRLRTLRPMERILRLDMPPRGISRSMEFVERDSCLWKKRVRWEEGGSGVRKGCMEGEETHLRSTLQPYAVRAVRTTTPFCSLLTLSGSERRREKSRRRPFHEQSGQRRRARRRPPRGPLGRRHGARVRTETPTLSAAPSRLRRTGLGQLHMHARRPALHHPLHPLFRTGHCSPFHRRGALLRFPGSPQRGTAQGRRGDALLVMLLSTACLVRLLLSLALSFLPEAAEPVFEFTAYVLARFEVVERVVELLDGRHLTVQLHHLCVCQRLPVVLLPLLESSIARGLRRWVGGSTLSR